LRDKAIKEIIVTTESGNVFEGNKDSQIAMTSVIVSLDSGQATQWKMADNSKAEIDREELKEALFLSTSKLKELIME
jgi:wyosine [tRNA(Phe)-imidazoG37] synthetase (radical SAM superfamily)